MRQSGLARCQFGNLKNPEKYGFLKKKKTKRDKIMIRILTDETYGKT